MRPTTAVVRQWYTENSTAAWSSDRPTWKEARVHAKCLRSTEQVSEGAQSISTGWVYLTTWHSADEDPIVHAMAG